MPRSSCPSGLDLASLIAGQLPAEQAGTLTGHVAACTFCQQRLRVLSA